MIKGRWSGYTFLADDGREFKTKDGIRGINVPSVAVIVNGQVVSIKVLKHESN